MPVAFDFMQRVVYQCISHIVLEMKNRNVISPAMLGNNSHSNFDSSSILWVKQHILDRIDKNKICKFSVGISEEISISAQKCSLRNKKMLLQKSLNVYVSLYLSLSRCIKWIGAKKMFVIFEESFFSLLQTNKQTSWCNTPQAMNVRSSVTVYYICALYLNVSIVNVIIIFICIIAQKLAKRKKAT